MKFNLKQNAIMNVLQYQAIELESWKRMVAEMCGYEAFTTFYGDLSVAEAFGVNSIKETYERVLKSWKDDYKYLTEFVMCLNHKCWEFYEKDAYRKYPIHLELSDESMDEIGQLYSDLYYSGRDFLYETFKGNEEAEDYIFSVLD